MNIGSEMQEISSNNKRIAKNTLLLYFRMLVTMAVSLYTSRVVLNILGVEDFGIYNVVGGIVAMFGFINGSMTSATQRYLTFELGQNNRAQLTKVFSTSLSIHTGRGPNGTTLRSVCGRAIGPKNVCSLPKP